VESQELFETKSKITRRIKSGLLGILHRAFPPNLLSGPDNVFRAEWSQYLDFECLYGMKQHSTDVLNRDSASPSLEEMQQKFFTLPQQGSFTVSSQLEWPPINEVYRPFNSACAKQLNVLCTPGAKGEPLAWGHWVTRLTRRRSGRRVAVKFRRMSGWRRSPCPTLW